MDPSANVKKNKKNYAITVRVTFEDKRRFDSFAAADGVSSASALRRLIKSVLRGELSLADIFKKIGYGSLERQKAKTKRAEMKTRLDNEQEKRSFFKLSRELDLMPGTLVRVLVKFYISANDSSSGDEEME
jgi:hypothetical protein